MKTKLAQIAAAVFVATAAGSAMADGTIDVSALVTQIGTANAPVLALGMAAIGVLVTVFTIKVIRRAL
ncbi:major capsid protein [Chromobacterium sp. TRC.1.1.SA]|uniref:Major capsid protein n=1 Tax=Chromobacterium indicum TaxID=3110228 RepID=A0ABV0CRF8_9NEIS